MAKENSDIEKNDFVKMYDRMFESCRDKDINAYETRLAICEEFLRTAKEMQGTDLEPYLAEIGCCKDFSIEFRAWLIPYSDLLDWSV